MVWFQCDDCGENLKKPKLVNHFRGCSAQQLSCIDCGVVFDQQSVQGHTQCVSEAEKYGPKNTGCSKKETIKPLVKEQNCDDIDVSRGLSARAPWSCSLCNVKATSQETLMLHSQGKKHRSKVKATTFKGNVTSTDGLGVIVAALSVDKRSEMDELSTVASDYGLGERDANNSKKESGFPEKAFAEPDCSQQHHKSADTTVQPESYSAFTRGSTKEQPESKQKKRKREAEVSRSEPDARCPLMGVKHSQVESSADCGNHLDELSKKKQRMDLVGEDAGENWSSSVKWKKIIRRTLKNAPDGSLKIKKLSSSILPLVMEVAKKFDLRVSKESFIRELGKQIQSHATFIFDGKRVRLAVNEIGE